MIVSDGGPWRQFGPPLGKRSISLPTKPSAASQIHSEVVREGSIVSSDGRASFGDPHVRGSARLAYTDSRDFCGESGLSDCAEAVVTISTGFPVTAVLHALAAFPEGSSPRVSAVSFGIEYDPEKLQLIAYQTCADFDLPTDDWPDPGSGTALWWEEARDTELTELGWFVAYAYSEADSSRFELTPHPTQGGNFADDADPARLDAIEAFCVLGVGMGGGLSCPGVPGEPDQGDDDSGYSSEADTLVVPISISR